MKRMIVIASFLLGLIGFTATILRAQQESGQRVKQRVTKKTNIVAARAGVRYQGPPRFVSIQDSSISYATNTLQEVIRIGDSFYLNLQDVWLVSANAQGPWMVARYIPKAVSVIVCSQLSADPFEPYQLCALPWASGLSNEMWKPSQLPFHTSLPF